MPSIINQKENMYNGMVTEICNNTTSQEGSESQDDFVVGVGEDDWEVVGVCCLVGGGVKRTPSISIG